MNKKDFAKRKSGHAVEKPAADDRKRERKKSPERKKARKAVKMNKEFK